MRTPVAGILSLFAAASLHADPNPIDFKAGDGYSAGTLNGQNNWVIKSQAPANGDLVVKPGEGLELTDNTSPAHNSAFAFAYDKGSPVGRDNFTSGTQFTETIEFIIRQEPGPKKGRIVGLGWGLFVPVAGNCLPFLLEFSRDTEAGGYRMRMVSLFTKTKIEGENNVIIPEAALGLTAQNNTSDPLQLCFTLVNEGPKTDWSSISMLVNTKTHQAFTLKNQMTAPEVYKKDDFIRSVINLRRAGEDGLSSMVITKLDSEPAVDPNSQ